MKAKIGRPRLEVTRSVLIGARFTAEEAQQIESAVSELTQGKSEWIREVLLSAAGKIAGPQRTLPPPVAIALPLDGDGFLD
jgi:hypothetical protein